MSTAEQTQMVQRLDRAAFVAEAQAQWETARLLAMLLLDADPEARDADLGLEWDDDGDAFVALGQVFDSEGEELAAASFKTDEIVGAVGRLSFGNGSTWTMYAETIEQNYRCGTHVERLDIREMLAGEFPL